MRLGLRCLAVGPEKTKDPTTVSGVPSGGGVTSPPHGEIPARPGSDFGGAQYAVYAEELF